MNSAHLHLMFTHLPLVGLGFTIITSLFAHFWKSDELKKFSLWAYIILGGCAILAYVTGDGSAEIIKTYPGITEKLTEPHEEIAVWFLVGIMALSAIAFTGLFYLKKGKINLQKINLVLLILSLLLSIVAIQTAVTGGKIRHTEIEQGIYKAP